MQEQKEQSKAKGGKIVFTVCVITIVLLFALVVFLLVNRQGSGQETETDEPVRRSVVVNEDNVEEVIAQQMEEEITPVGSYEVMMNFTWNFASGGEASDNAYVENVERNQNSVYFDVTLSDTGETIYESPIIPVGSHLENIILDSDLSAGTYDCLIEYHLLDEEDKSVSTLTLTLTIVVEQ